MRYLIRFVALLLLITRAFSQDPICNSFGISSSTRILKPENYLTSQAINLCDRSINKTVLLTIPTNDHLSANHNHWKIDLHHLTEPKLDITTKNWELGLTPTDFQITRQLFEHSRLGFITTKTNLNNLAIAGPGINSGALDIDIRAWSERHYGLEWQQSLFSDFSATLQLANNRVKTQVDFRQMSVQMETGSKPFELALNTGTSSGSGRLEIDYELITLQWQKQNTYMNYQWLKAALNAEARLYITEENVRMLTGTTADINWHQFNFGWNSAHWLAATKLSYVELNTDSFVRARVGLLTVGGSDIEINNAILWWAEPKISYRGNFNSLAYQLTLAHWIPIHLNLTNEEFDASTPSDQATTTTDLDSSEGYRFANGLSMHFRLSYKF